ncbi:MAG: prolyl oligopeptidase family serine peptidase [Lutibacter sp.]|nr:prolyl oligopeptidase family serine peptidase [Lutibacter sp.]
MKYKKTFLRLSMFLVFVYANAQNSEISLFEKKQFIQNNDTLNYRILYPINFSKEKQYPAVLFLHGSGERGNDNSSQLIHGSSLFLAADNQAQFPAIILFPQCPENDYWANVTVDRTTQPISLKFSNGDEPTKSLGLTMTLMDILLNEPYVEKNQLYVMGLSMGGMGAFEILARKPAMFAAAIPICGGGNPETAVNYATNTALWIFHGAKDDVVNPLLSIEMVTGILKAGGKPSFTLYDKDNHNSWDSAFAEPQLLPWLFSKNKK